MQANLFTGSFSSPAHQVVEMAALASCIGAKAMFRPIPSSKPTVQLPSGNGTASLMSRHDLVNLFARKTPLAKQRPPQAQLQSTLVEVEKPTTKFDNLFHKLEPYPDADLQTFHSSFVIERAADLSDDIDEKAGLRVTIQIVSTSVDSNFGKALISDEVAILNWCRTLDMLVPTKFVFNLDFRVHKDFGTPGAIIVRNRHKNEFLLDSFTLTLPDNSAINFPTRTWIYNTSNPKSNDHPGRFIFSNERYLPSKTPPGLETLRAKELENLRGDGTGERKFNDRIYDYDVYNDLGDPDLSQSLKRQVLGGSNEFPYPRRCRTGRRLCQTDPKSESKHPLFYIPRDERFIKSPPEKDFGSVDDIRKLYAKTADAPPKFPGPAVIAVDENAWSTDVEFAREMLAGLNPLLIQRLKKFPIESSLDPKEYGDPESLITKKILEEGMKDIEGEPITVDKALEEKRLFVLDYYDIFLPYVNKINAQEGRAMYAPRTVLFLTKDKILLPLAIELALPPSTSGDKKNSRVFTPKQQRDGVWPLAKAHVASVDTSVHEVISHFLRTHACIEPFIIATNRHLSVLHPINEVLSPHFKKTMDINQGARKDLISAGGIIEATFIPGAFAMELGSVVYKLDWQFDQQSLPEDLIKRGMAERDPKSPHGIKLVISDYPYAADGLELWAALKEYMTDYIRIFYKDETAVLEDTELQSWWTEVKTKGHEDKKDSAGWPPLNSIENLAFVLTTIAWVASCHHAAVNFGQYPYGGFVPNRPSMTRQLIPEEDTAEYKDLSDPKKWEKAFLATVPNQSQATIVMTTLRNLSSHSPNEEYLGQRVTPNWSNHAGVLSAFNKFSQRIKDVEHLINTRNAEDTLKNRTGPVKLPYVLLHPSSPTPGITGTGVPNSISI